jgi:uncharacterized membrane protein YedE/YeeE
MPDALLAPIFHLSKGVLLVGGVLIGFGTRYAGGCSGHAISGLSNLQI